ncbi:hypothetical protein D3OALGA1CA_4863 [Olavius algarvensis associated proteobacterium Delta 3]|nr:hypothetical protein D3OALGB2SA_719 [Olavius algarvensis associated proteobacterium Delta 3]CAB5158022.1 hypothetical protein D3OALGA1CA_4863 [Olavius algarvensis associated proteobacterium Delta 3]
MSGFRKQDARCRPRRPYVDYYYIITITWILNLGSCIQEEPAKPANRQTGKPKSKSQMTNFNLEP